MLRFIRFVWIPLALTLSACDVQVQDATPAEFNANHDIGMYNVTATVTRGAMVTPGSVFVFALGDNQKVTLTPNADGSEWKGLYSARCRSSFPLQFLVEWKGLFDVRHKVAPVQPKAVKLIEPPLTRTAGFDTSGKEPKGGWPGSVKYRFVTVPSASINSAHIEPWSQTPAEIAAAKAISVVSPLPVVVGCGDLGEIRIASTQPRAHGTLVIDTDDPAVPHWQTSVEFSPK